MPVGIYERSEKQKNFCRIIGKLGGKKRTLKDKICPVCKKSFRPKYYSVKHCSIKCSLKNMPKHGEQKECKICGKTFYVKPVNLKTAKYCSQKCQHRGLDKNYFKKCKQCGAEYRTTPSQEFYRGSSFCSKDCCATYRKTKYYKNNKKKYTTNAKIKKLFWKIFSEYIRRRDSINGYATCISCGKKDYWRNMDAGHYIPKTAGLALYFNEQNVNSQCTYCNRWMHGNLSKYAIGLRKKYGDNILKELNEKRHKIIKIRTPEYKKLIEEYKKKIDVIIKK